MNEDKRVIIDYLSVTFPLILSETEDEQDRSEITYRFFREYFGLHHCQCRHEAYATNHFKYQYTLSEYITLRCAGPANNDGLKTCQLELKGEGCREFERISNGKTWVDLFDTLIGLDSTFKRIDITIDDFSGVEVNQEYIVNKLRSGQFTSKFKSKPKYHGFLDEGFTIEMGSRKSPIELVIYDKRAEQLSKRKKVDHEYWCRYEMRFRQAKAESVVMALLTKYKNNNDELYGLDLMSFAKSELLTILELKEDSDYDDNNKYKIETDSKWKAFLDDCEKIELPKIEERETNYETRRTYVMPKAAPIIGCWYAMCNRDMKLFIHDFLKEMYRLFGKFTAKQKKRFNECLYENGIEPLNDKEFEKFKREFYEYYTDMELPF